jgi:preprotein translocase subunit SecB
MRVYLTESHIAERDYVDDEQPEGDFSVSISLMRYSPIHMGVSLTVETLPESPLALRVTYAADYEMHPSMPEDQRDSEWRHVAYYLAPSLLYPYIREHVSSITSRMRLVPLHLPFVPIPLQIPEEEMLVPETPPGTDFQPELPLQAAVS